MKSYMFMRDAAKYLFKLENLRTIYTYAHKHPEAVKRFGLNETMLLDIKNKAFLEDMQKHGYAVQEPQTEQEKEMLEKKKIVIEDSYAESIMPAREAALRFNINEQTLYSAVQRSRVKNRENRLLDASIIRSGKNVLIITAHPEFQRYVELMRAKENAVVNSNGKLPFEGHPLKRNARETRLCAVCEKPIIDYHLTRVYCSRKCWHDARRPSADKEKRAS